MCNHDWEFLNDDLEVTRSYILTDSSTSAQDNYVYLVIKDRPCINGTLTIDVAATDFDSAYETLRIGINDTGLTTCDPGAANSCIPDYNCIDSLFIGDVYIGQRYQIAFVLSNNRIQKNQGCNNYSLVSNITLSCKGSITLNPTATTTSPTKHPSISPFFGPTTTPTKSPTTSCEGCYNDYLDVINDDPISKINTFEIEQTGTEILEQHIWFTFKERPCRNGNITIEVQGLFIY